MQVACACALECTEDSIAGQDNHQSVLKPDKSRCFRNQGRASSTPTNLTGQRLARGIAENQLVGPGGKCALTAQPGPVVERLARERDTTVGWRRPAIVPPRSRATRQSGRPPRTSQYAVHQAARAAVLLFVPYLKDVACGQLVAEGQRNRARRRIRVAADAPRRARLPNQRRRPRL